MQGPAFDRSRPPQDTHSPSPALASWLALSDDDGAVAVAAAASSSAVRKNKDFAAGLAGAAWVLRVGRPQRLSPCMSAHHASSSCKRRRREGGGGGCVVGGVVVAGCFLLPV
jgi:hypothetical protein